MVLLLAFASACGGGDAAPNGGGASGRGGSSSDGGSGGGVGGSAAGGSGGGSGGSAGGAGSGGAPINARGGFSLHIVPGDGCTLPEQWLDFPLVAGGHPVTEAQAVQLIADGATAQVTNSSGNLIQTTVSRLSCSWVPDPGFDIHVGFRFGPAGNDGTLSMSADTRVGQPSTDGILLVGPDWDERNYSGQCTYTTLFVDDATRSVRGSVVCPVLSLVNGEPGAVPEVCTLSEGYFAFENCPIAGSNP